MVQNCLIYKNQATEIGGGVKNWCGIISHCIVFNNKSSSGGGITNGIGTVTHCIAYSNEATSDGGGIRNIGGIVNNCASFNNQSNYGGGFDNHGTLNNCMAYGNLALMDGGGIYNENNSIVTNCTVYGNQASSLGGGIYNIDDSAVINSILWKNVGGDAYNSLAGFKFSCFGSASDDDGNFSANPLFVNTSGDMSTWDFHLKNGSPCIDAGTLDGSPLEDMEGNPRPGGDAKICIGAYESPDEYLPDEPEPAKRLYVKPEGNDDADGESWESALKTFKKSIDRTFLSDSSHEIWVAKGTFMEGETINIPGAVMLLGGFEGTETNLEQRDWSISPTIIDGENLRRCITNNGVIDGFHITRGNIDGDGGGIYNLGTVAHCSISDCTAKCGGGIYNHIYGIVNDSVIYNNNSIDQGGGIYNYYEGKVSNCALYDNLSILEGGGIFNSYNGLVSNCSVYGNHGTNNGGGVYNYYGTISHSIIYGNLSNIGGGGVCNYRGMMRNCIINNNQADTKGGGIYNFRATINNCTITDNTSMDSLSSGVYNDSGTISNSISWNNEGGGYPFRFHHGKNRILLL
ncbi:hypothetical protein JW926_11980 [Candidatus Sumerlaeota bacterium]|nr:hypothetical protein [Candidatus Sumerlaeota bacterium]